MTMWEGLAMGFSNLGDPIVVLMLLLGSLLGTVIGALPGLGSLTGCALLLPIAFSMPTPQQGLTLLCAIYLGVMFGGRITAILINVPGDAIAICTSLDGYPLMKQGRGGVALGISALSSFFGGAVSFILLAAFSPPLAKLALKFGPPEYTAIMLFGLAAVVGLGEKQVLRSFISLFLGMLIATIGTDNISATRRYVWSIQVFDGIELLVIALGMFGLAELMFQAETIPSKVDLNKQNLSVRQMFPTWAEIKQCFPGIIRGTFIGTFVGFLPGSGATIATFVTYSTEVSISKHPEEFGKGCIEGVAAPEAANNSCVGGSMIPMFSLGIPGSPTAALLLGAMTMYGLQTGPRVFERSGDIVWTMIVGLMVANVVLLLMNTLMIPLFVKLVDVGQLHLKPIICVAVMVGAFSVTFSVPKMFYVVVFGLLGYVFKRLKYPAGPFLLGLVLERTFETSFRQSMVISNNSFSIFFSSTLSVLFIVLSVFAVIYPIAKGAIKDKKEKKKAAEA